MWHHGISQTSLTFSTNNDTGELKSYNVKGTGELKQIKSHAYDCQVHIKLIIPRAVKSVPKVYQKVTSWLYTLAVLLTLGGVAAVAPDSTSSDISTLLSQPLHLDKFWGQRYDLWTQKSRRKFPLPQMEVNQKVTTCICYLSSLTRYQLD